VRAFQLARGLRSDGICDETTWSALIEANWDFGDRLLFLTSPNLRGDDVSELQTRLARLGFDCGRVDGILGPRTAAALSEFQSNCGLPADGVCGPSTVRSILVVSAQTGDGPGVGVVRERERLREAAGSLAKCRIVVGQFGGLSALTRVLARQLRLKGATVITLDEPDVIAQARAANQFAADAYLGFEPSTDSAAVAHFYRVPTFESIGGRALAESVANEFRVLDGFHPEVVGMRLPILRETKMPAVLVTIGSVRAVSDAAGDLVEATLRAFEQWISRVA
jgi:N-acetylmuramoyl-L-alanine amidase